LRIGNEEAHDRLRSSGIEIILDCVRGVISAPIHEFLVHLFVKSQKILTFSMRN